MSAPQPHPGTLRIKAHMLGGAPTGQRPPAALLNSNESAYGASPHALNVLRASVSCVERYLEHPDRLLCPAIGAAEALDPAKIAIGHGSDDLLARIARIYLRPGDNLIRSANGYLKVPNYAFANDAEVISVPDDDFVPSVDRMIAAVTDRTRIVYLANPENPAGTYLSGAEVRRLHAALRADILLVLDCAYEEYVDATDYEPGRILAGQAKNVVVSHTFSKIHGLAGARVGWVYGDADIINVVRKIGVTFPLTTPSAYATLAALEDRQHMKMVRKQNANERAKLFNKLEKLGLTPIPSQTNFQLVHVPGRAIELENFLRDRGILIRRFAAPAYADYIRITLGLPNENRSCADAIAEFLEESQ